MNDFLLLLGVLSVLAGATASVVGFGIGSLLTPLLAWRFGTEIAVAAVMVPHAIATALRCWRLRAHIDVAVLRRFGVPSAVGALVGALLFTRVGSGALTGALGGLLVLTAMAQLSGWATRWHPEGALVGGFGLASGFFGGLAGNQGGLRSAALLAFGLAPLALVATATATGLLVDAVRAPIYLWSTGSRLPDVWLPIAVTTGGVVIGTLLGERVLLGLSRRRFGQVIGVAIGGLGLWLLWLAAVG